MSQWVTANNIINIKYPPHHPHPHPHHHHHSHHGRDRVKLGASSQPVCVKLSRMVGRVGIWNINMVLEPSLDYVHWCQYTQIGKDGRTGWSSRISNSNFVHLRKFASPCNAERENTNFQISCRHNGLS